MEHLSQLRQRAAKFAAVPAEVVVVGLSGAQRLAEVAQAYRLPFRCLPDPERRLYRLYGLGHGELAAFLRPAALRRYRRTWRQGVGLRVAPTEDPWQMGGDFLLAPDGRVALAHYSRYPGDRPEVEALLVACATAGGAGGR